MSLSAPPALSVPAETTVWTAGWANTVNVSLEPAHGVVTPAARTVGAIVSW